MVMDMKLQMVDLHGQYLKIKKEVDTGIRQVIETSAFINGPQVKEFASNLATYSGCKHVITCGNGTDALQIACIYVCCFCRGDWPFRFDSCDGGCRLCHF